MGGSELLVSGYGLVVSFLFSLVLLFLFVFSLRFIFLFGSRVHAAEWGWRPVAAGFPVQ